MIKVNYELRLEGYLNKFLDVLTIKGEFSLKKAKAQEIFKKNCGLPSDLLISLAEIHEENTLIEDKGNLIIKYSPLLEKLYYLNFLGHLTYSSVEKRIDNNTKLNIGKKTLNQILLNDYHYCMNLFIDFLKIESKN